MFRNRSAGQRKQSQARNGRAGVCVVLWSRAIRGALVIETDGPYSALSLSRRKPLTRDRVAERVAEWQGVGLAVMEA